MITQLPTTNLKQDLPDRSFNRHALLGMKNKFSLSIEKKKQKKKTKQILQVVEADKAVQWRQPDKSTDGHTVRGRACY